MKWTKRLMALSLVLATLYAAGCSPRRAAAPDPKKAAPVPVKVAVAETGTIVKTKKLGGRIVAANEVTVTAKTAGRAVSVPVKTGQRVTAGALLIQLEDKDAAAQLRQALAAVAQAETGNTGAAANLERMRSLLAEGAISQQQFDQVKTESEIAAARLLQAKAAADLARTALENTRITAPVSGLVAGLQVEPGEMVGPGQPLLTIHDIDTVFAEVDVAENDVGRIAPGGEVEVAVPALGDAVFTGRIASVDPAASAVSRAFLARVELPNPGHLIKPGMFAEVRLVTDKRENALLIPTEAVIDQAGKTGVFVYEAGVAHERAVATGLGDGKRVEIVKGLSRGEKVIVAGQNMVADNTPVTVQTAGR